MQNKPFTFLFICTLFTVIGLAGGFVAGSQTLKSEGGHDAHGHDDHGNDKKDSHGEEAKVLSAQSLKNLNVKVEEIEVQDYTTYRGVSAQIENTPKTIQTIIAPFGGTVKGIEVEHGELVKKGTTLLTLMRDSIPRPELKLTQSLLDPEQRLKGLSIDEISNMEKKSSGEKQSYIWKKSLKRFGYWSNAADRVWRSLPKDIRKLPYSIAVIGELSATGYLKKDFVNWVAKDKIASNNFFEISSLLLDGKGLSLIKNLNSLGALDSLISIKVPSLSEDFDVHNITVKPGDHVEMGQVLGELHNSRELHIEAHARGSEIPMLMNALENDVKMSAVPITKNAGEKLSNLVIRNILDDSDKGGATVHLEISGNTSVIKNGKKGKRFRSWKIRVGSRYILQVPQKIFKDVFVIPSDAVVDDGVDKIVFIQDGETYIPSKVVVLYQNDEVAILSQDDSEFFPGDPVVVRGAFGLGLALKAQTGGAVDPHAGHNH
ncbi:MAG: hypothetical protein COA79_20100 [Planctomycetota bacterium]|nr:MAG: hypothetical protein COA79_20100 [Planctomycetota bacterium]